MPHSVFLFVSLCFTITFACRCDCIIILRMSTFLPVSFSIWLPAFLPSFLYVPFCLPVWLLDFRPGCLQGEIGTDQILGRLK